MSKRGSDPVPVDMTRLRNLASAVQQRTAQSQQQRDTHGRSWYRIEVNNQTQNAEIYLYDIIGEWGVSAADFVNELRGVRALSIDLHVNSEGGEIFDGLAIYEALLQHPAHVTAMIDGLAASSASFIVQAADERVMGRRSRMMIHDGHGLVIGNAADMREMADLLDNLSDNIADIYAERAGGTRKQWRAAMLGPNRASDGTWYDAQQAVEAGLADRVGDAGSSTSDGGEVATNRTTVPDRPHRTQPSEVDEQTAEFVAAWNPALLLDVTKAATEEPPEPIDWSGLKIHTTLP